MHDGIVNHGTPCSSGGAHFGGPFSYAWLLILRLQEILLKEDRARKSLLRSRNVYSETVHPKRVKSEYGFLETEGSYVGQILLWWKHKGSVDSCNPHIALRGIREREIRCKSRVYA